MFQIFNMWEGMTRVHQKALLSLLGHGPKDLLLVGDCGGRVKVHSHLLALHSPLAASLLDEMGGGEGSAISLPLPLASLTSLIRIQGHNCPPTPLYLCPREFN